MFVLTLEESEQVRQEHPDRQDLDALTLETRAPGPGPGISTIDLAISVALGLGMRFSTGDFKWALGKSLLAQAIVVCQASSWGLPDYEEILEGQLLRMEKEVYGSRSMAARIELLGDKPSSVHCVVIWATKPSTCDECLNLSPIRGPQLKASDLDPTKFIQMLMDQILTAGHGEHHQNMKQLQRKFRFGKYVELAVGDHLMLEAFSTAGDCA
eukprot:3324127-Amphidinium_carterae.4